MSGSEIKQLEQQIDKNKNQILEEKEILDFIKDEKNLKSLGNFLKKLPMQSPYLSQKILNWIQASTLFNTQFQNWIKRKLQSNQSLTDKELQLLYIQAQIDPKCILKPQLSITSTSSPAFHISKTSLDRYWGKFLSQYLQAKYGKNSYSTAEERSDARFKNRNTSQEKQKEKEVRLPNINFKEGFSNVAIDRLQQRAKDNFYSELSKEKQWAQLRNSRKWEFKEAFVNYDLLLFAFNKYTELVNKKQEEVIKASGYKNAEDFFKQLKLIQDFNKFLEKKTKEKFPNLDQILTSFSQFQKEQEALEKKYFKSNTEKQKVEQTFKNALKYQENLSKKYDLENIKKRFGSEPQKPEEAQKFFEDLNSLQAYQNELEAFQKRTQNVQNKYNSYLKDQQQLIQKYGKDNLKKSSEALHLYRIMLAWYKKAYSDINFDAYEKYGKIASKNRLTEELASIQSLKEILFNPLHKDFPLHLGGVKSAELEKQAKQAAIDKNWTMIKKSAPIIYTCLNAGTSVWNWLVDSTIGVWSSLGLMLKKLWESDDEWKSSAEFKEKFDNFFKISLSTSQKNSIYDSETGEFNMNWDNGVSQVASSISQMITLIYGGGAIAKGIGMGAAKTGLKLWSNIASKAGLFSMAFTQQVGQSFQEGMQAGMNGKEALAYSFLSSGLQGSLELISPNEILLGKGSGVAKGFIKEVCKKGSKQSLKEVWKLFTTTIGKEIFEENIQEAVQLAAWNLMNQWANKTWGTELPSDWNLKNFAATAIITTLTTWVTTGASSLTNMPGILKNQDKAKLKAHILSNTELHADVMQVLEQAINGKVNLNISKEDLITLKEELNASQTNIKKIEVIQKNQETQSTDKPKYFEGKESKFWLSEVQARKNSQFMDQISSTINQTNQAQQLQNLNTEISKQYQEATGKELHLSDDQLLSILDAHKQDGKLGKLTLWELKTKANILDKTIPDPEVRSFLLEAGFINEEANIFPNQVVKKIKDGIQMISKKYKFLRWEELILTDQEVDNLLKIITQLWINVSEFNIKKLSEISSEQIEKVVQTKEGLQQLGIEVDEYNIEKLSEISPEQINNFIKTKEGLQQLGIKVDKSNIKELSEIPPEQIEKVMQIKEGLQQLWINVNAYNIKELSEIPPEQIEKVVQIKEGLQQLGIEVDEYNIEKLSEISPEQIEKVVQIKEGLQQLWIEVKVYNIKELSEISPEQIEKVVQIKEGLQQLGIKVDEFNIKKLSEISPEQIEKVMQIKEGLQQLGIEVDVYNIEELSEISPEQIEKVMQIKEGLQQSWINVNAYNIKGLSEISPSWLKELIKHDIRISSEGELILASQLIWDYNIATIKGLLDRKAKYLEKYQTLSDKRFDELFRNVDQQHEITKIKQQNLKYGKNGIAEIEQTTLGYCYAYTGFNLLKRSNFFEVMIKTSIRETSEWWEVKVPFWSKNGKIIKVWKQEIHDSYRVLDKDTWTYNSFESETTSKTSPWMKILEIAFIKEYILEQNNLGDQHAKSEETRTIYKQAIESAKESFKKTGDFKLNGELLWAVEWGLTGNFLDRMIWENVVKRVLLNGNADLSKKDALFDFINNGTLKIKVGSNEDNPHLKVNWNFTIKDIWGKELTLITEHAYSLERVYTTKSWEKVAVISNPRNTHEKIHINRNDAMTKFHSRNVSYISPQKLFTE